MKVAWTHPVPILFSGTWSVLAPSAIVLGEIQSRTSSAARRRHLLQHPQTLLITPLAAAGYCAKQECQRARGSRRHLGVGGDMRLWLSPSRVRTKCEHAVAAAARVDARSRRARWARCSGSLWVHAP